MVSKLPMRGNINQQSSHPVKLFGKLANFLNGRLQRGDHRLNSSKQVFGFWSEH